MTPCRTQLSFSQTLTNLSFSRYSFFVFETFFTLSIFLCFHINIFFHFRTCALCVAVLERVPRGSYWLVHNAPSVTILTVSTAK